MIVTERACPSDGHGCTVHVVLQVPGARTHASGMVWYRWWASARSTRVLDEGRVMSNRDLAPPAVADACVHIWILHRDLARLKPMTGSSGRAQCTFG